jgi:6-phosphogluconolactonase (cycloisomerase 2 family)
MGRLIVDQYRSNSGANENSLNIFPNTPNPRQPIIHCTMAMLTFCATATNVQLDSSGQYLFLTDPATQAVHVASIDLSSGKVRDTGNAMPMTSQTPGFAFSPDGSIVYAMLADDRSVHFYRFDRASGSLSEGGTPLALASGSGICPAQHQ